MLLVLLASVALALDAVDGRVARDLRVHFGARFDGERSTLLILVLSVHVAVSFSSRCSCVATHYTFSLAGLA